MTIKLSDTYKEIFETYLNFCPYYRRNLISLTDMYKWLTNINLKNGYFFLEYDFSIMMEWLSAIELIKPIAVLSYPLKSFKNALFEVRTNSSKLDQLYKDGLISFPEEIYNLNNKSPNEVRPWEYRVYKLEIDDNDDGSTQDIEYERDHYLYHPIQFFQFVTYLRGSTIKNLLNKKEYKEFYWRRRLTFNDSLVKTIEKNLKKSNLSKEQYITQQSNKGTGYHQIEFLIYRQHRWLIEKALLLWLKFESIYKTKFLRPSNSREIDMEFQISLWESHIENKYKKSVQKYYEWYASVLEKFSKYFSIDDYATLKVFLERSDIQLNFDGLDKFKDLFLLINDEKKSKLKGFSNFFMNMLQVVKTLKFFIDKFIIGFPELENEKYERKWYEPIYFFEEEQEKELNDYIQKVYMDYGLMQKDIYIVYVEGPTEVILLEDWFDLVYYRTKIKVSVKPLPSGKRTAFMFEYLIKEFKAKEHFLILDQDTLEYAKGKKAQLKGKGISEESFYIFFPDFVTANFKPTEIIEAFKNYFNDINDKIYKVTGKKKDLTEEDLTNLNELLNNKMDSDKFEDLIEKFLQIKLQNSLSKLKKTVFAQNLLLIMRNNLSQTSRSQVYPFEEIIGKFVSKIQRKKYPGVELGP